MDTLKQYVDLLPPYLTRRFISAEQDAVIVSGRVPDDDASKLLPIVDRLDKKLNTVREKYPGYQIAVTGLSVIAARNSASMIDKLSRGLTIEIVFVAAFIGLAFRSFARHADQHPARHLSHRACRLPVVGTGQGLQFASVIALTVSFGLGLSATIHFLNRLQIEDIEPGSRGGRRARDDTGRPAVDPDLGGARLRPGDDGVFQPAVAAPVRLAERLCHDRGVDRRFVHLAADGHVF